MLKKIIGLIVLVIIIVAGFWIHHAMSGKKNAAVVVAKPAIVEMTVAKSEDWPEQVVTTGEVTSFHGIKVSCRHGSR